MSAGFLVARPLKVSECAFYMGMSSEYIRQAITVGVPVKGQVVQLEAETLTRTRCTYRIHEHAFIAFLQAIGWKHLPGRTSASPRHGAGA